MRVSLTNIRRVVLFDMFKPIFLELQNHTQSLKLSSAAWKANKRRVFETVGHFTGGEWQLTQPVFPSEMYGFNGRHFTVITNLVSPSLGFNTIDL